SETTTDLTLSDTSTFCNLGRYVCIFGILYRGGSRSNTSKSRTGRGGGDNAAVAHIQHTRPQLLILDGHFYRTGRRTRTRGFDILSHVLLPACVCQTLQTSHVVGIFGKEPCIPTFSTSTASLSIASSLVTDLETSKTGTLCIKTSAALQF
ncbi:hypothetical protein BOTBODRAFT_511249, partial [Botryobasidium botryosum FD-172 SS1]